MGEKTYLTVEEAAAQLRVAVDTMRRYLRESRLPCARIGKRYLVPARAVQAYIEKRLVNTSKPGRKRKAKQEERQPK